MSLILFELPELNRDQLDVCSLRLDALEAWLDELPLAHPEKSHQQLNQLLEEFNQLKFLPLRRLEWLNLIQPLVLNVAQALDNSSHLQQESDLAQGLQHQLAQGYKRVVNDLLKLRDQLSAPILARSLLQALFSAIHHSGALVFRACLFSIQAPATSWSELNLLYNLACQSRLQHKTLQNKTPKNCEQAYFQVILLALIQAESLRQDEISLLFPLLGQWSQLLNRLAADHPNQLFVISAEHNFLPQRTNLTANPNIRSATGVSTKSRNLALDTRVLIGTLETYLVNSNLSKRLTQHLASCLDEISTRITPRIDTNEPIELVLGLRSAHFHMNKMQTLDSLIASNIQNENQGNPRSAALNIEENTAEEKLQRAEITTSPSMSLKEELKKRYPVYLIQQINASATGYCLFWQEEITALLKTGELIAFREKPSQPWQAGLIRWVREAAEGQQLGIERLGGRMQPCAIKPIIKIGEPRDFMPGFLIPELQVLGVPAGLITPRLPFREGQKVEINHSQGIKEAKLAELISSPGEFNHFRLEYLNADGLSLH